MAVPRKSSSSADPLDIPHRPLSIRTLPPRRTVGSVDDPTERVRKEFIEMRGFSPTAAQAARLFGLSREECDRILGRLVRDGFLRCSPDGRYRLPS